MAHPIFSREGDYPKIMKEKIAEKRAQKGEETALPEFTQDQIRKLRGSADMLGINYIMSYIAQDHEFR